MKLLLTLFAVLFSMVFAMSAPVDDEARDKRHLLVGPAVVPVPLLPPAPFIHAPLVVGPHWGSPLPYAHPTIVKYW